MYNLTYLGHRVTLPWLDPRSNFDLDLSRSNYTWFDAPWRDKHDGIKIVALPLKLKILSSKNRCGKFWNFDPWVTSILTWAKKWPKWFRNDFSRAFERRFPFCSTMRRSRDRRGGVQTPPPSRSWKIQRPSRARVKLVYSGGTVSVPNDRSVSGKVRLVYAAFQDEPSDRSVSGSVNLVYAAFRRNCSCAQRSHC